MRHLLIIISEADLAGGLNLRELLLLDYVYSVYSGSVLRVGEIGHIFLIGVTLFLYTVEVFPDSFTQLRVANDVTHPKFRWFFIYLYLGFVFINLKIIELIPILCPFDLILTLLPLLHYLLILIFQTLLFLKPLQIIYLLIK